MAKLEKFEDLMAWQKARELSQAIYRATCEGGWDKDRRLTDQIQGAVVSVMTCTGDGFERWEAAEAIARLTDAKTAAIEVRSCLYVALDAGYIEERSFDTLRAQAEEVSRMIGGWRGGVAKRKNANRSGGGSNYGEGRRSDESQREDRRAAYQDR